MMLLGSLEISKGQSILLKGEAFSGVWKESVIYCNNENGGGLLGRLKMV